MRAAAYDSFRGPITVRDLDDPRPPDGGAVIRVLGTGICRSDWHGWMGNDPDIRAFPHVPGHEFAGVIERVGRGVSGWKEGDRVIAPFCLGCGSCDACADDLPNVCDRYEQPGFTMWGSFAELVSIPYAEANLCAIPEEIDFITAASLGCRFSTAWRAVREIGRVASGEQVAVFGCGGVGLAAVMIAASEGAEVIAVDLHPSKLELARDLGASRTVAWSENVSEEIRMMTAGGAHASFDAAGNAAICRASIESLRKRGRHVQLGLIVGEDVHAPLPIPLVIARELQILGSHGMQSSRYGEIFEAIRAGRIAPGRLARKVVSLDNVAEEMEALGSFQTVGMSVVDLSLPPKSRS